jgi:hypothetical protein
MKIPHRLATIAFAFYMSIIISLVMCSVLTYISVGQYRAHHQSFESVCRGFAGGVFKCDSLQTHCRFTHEQDSSQTVTPTG